MVGFVFGVIFFMAVGFLAMLIISIIELDKYWLVFNGWKPKLVLKKDWKDRI